MENILACFAMLQLSRNQSVGGEKKDADNAGGLRQQVVHSILMDKLVG